MTASAGLPKSEGQASYPARLASRDFDEAIDYHLSEASENAARGFIDGLEQAFAGQMGFDGFEDALGQLVRFLLAAYSSSKKLARMG